LTSVGKPQKHLLQIDSAKRAFSQALSAIEGQFGLDVEFIGGGLLLKVSLNHTETKIKDEIENILSAYAIRYEIVIS
jgi:hypothetical protein